MPQTPQSGGQPPEPKPSISQLRTAQTLATISIIAGPISILIGGVLLSTVALVCGILALSKVRAVIQLQPKSDIALSIKRQAKVSIVISVLALVLNAISVVMVMPVLIQAMQSGDYTQLLGSAGIVSQGASSASSASSVWG